MHALGRRELLATVAAVPTALAWPGGGLSACPVAAVPVTLGTRALRARLLRTAVAQVTAAFPQPRHETNGEEGGPDPYPTYPYQANYTKALLKEGRAAEDPPGTDVDPRGSDVYQPAYRDYLAVLNDALAGRPADFCRIALGGVRKQTNPQGGVAFDLEGFDPHSVNLHLLFRNSSPNRRGSLRPPPRIDGLSLDGGPEPDHENAAEMIELYWMALLRDAHFADYTPRPETPTPETPTPGTPTSAGAPTPPTPASGKRTPEATAELAVKAAEDLDRKEIREAFHVTTPYPTEGGKITVGTLFRGSTPGDERGPYISQFLLRGNTLRTGPDEAVIQRPEDGIVLHGTQLMSQTQRTAKAGSDHLADVASWRRAQDGSEDPSGRDIYQTEPEEGPGRKAVAKFIRDLRDLATWVHLDYLYQHFLNAALILLYEPALGPEGSPPAGRALFSRGQRAFDALDFFARAVPARPEGSPDSVPPLPPPQLPFRPDPGNPYGRRSVENMQSCDGDAHIGFVTFGGPHVLTLLAEVTERALKAAWFQKWYVHRRARPEEFGGLVHFQKLAEEAGKPRDETPYPCVDRVILDAAVLALVKAQPLPPTGKAANTYLLSQVFPEGSPTHPAYPSGHATAAGACATILKAWFDETVVMTNPANNDPRTPPDPKDKKQTDPNRLPVAFEADAAGRELVKAARQDGGLTVGGELNKLASNIAIGRNGAGVHWRSDATEGMKLGEAVAAGILFEQAFTFEEEHSLSFTTFFTRERVTIGRRARVGAAGHEVFVRFVDWDHAEQKPVGVTQEEVFPIPQGA